MKGGGTMAEDMTIANLEAVWNRVDELCSGLTEMDWDKPTDCPGWSIKDQVSHMVGTEAALLRAHDLFQNVGSAREVRTAVTTYNDRVVEKRRSRAGWKVLDEFRLVTERRLKALRSMTEDDFGAKVMSPVGRVPYRHFMEIRIFDCWVHEQDIRRALGRRIALEGPLYEHALCQMLAGIPFVLAWRAEIPDGVTLLIEGTDPGGFILPLAFTDGRAHRLAGRPEDPTARIFIDAETFVRLVCGRLAADDAYALDAIRFQGDGSVGRRVVECLNILF